MKIRSILLVSLMIIFIFSMVACSTSKKPEESLSINDVSRIEINPQDSNKIVYEKDTNSKEIKEFIDVYNKAKPGDNSLGTTHRHIIVITLNNNNEINVLGGTQGFQTVSMDGKQFNIQGDELWNYFKQLK